MSIEPSPDRVPHDVSAFGQGPSPIQFAYALSGEAAGQKLTEDAAAQVLKAETLGWVHLDASHAGTLGWIDERMPYLDVTVRAALTQPSTRSRATRVGDGVLAVMRGINLNDGRDPEDMVSIRIWAQAERIVTLSRQRVRALEDIADSIAAGQGPHSMGAFLALLAERLNARIEPLIDELDQETDTLETAVIGSPDQALRHRIVVMRLQVIELRRHAAPQREALQVLETLELPGVDEGDRRHLREARDKLVRMVENMDEMRDSLAVLREELSGQISERLNRHMHILSILSAIFLPLGFLTGLLGINVGGLPGAENSVAFWLVCGGLGVVAMVQILFLRFARWL